MATSGGSDYEIRRLCTGTAVRRGRNVNLATREPSVVSLAHTWCVPQIERGVITVSISIRFTFTSATVLTDH